MPRNYLQVPQLWVWQEVQEWESADALLLKSPVPEKAKTEISFSTSPPHFSQRIPPWAEKLRTSFSNAWLHFRHLYSYRGMSYLKTAFYLIFPPL